VSRPAAPVAKAIPHEITVHGDTRVDNYFWLRERENPDTLAYLEAENLYATAVMESTAALQEQLFGEMLGRIKEDDASVPVAVDDWFYYTRTEKDRGYAIYCRKHGSLSAQEEIYLDCNQLAEGQKYFRLGTSARSPDHRLLAYATDYEGGEQYTVRVKDLATGKLLPDEIHNTYASLQWANDNKHFFYTVLDEAMRPYRLYRHELGAAEDVLIYEETDARFELEIGKSRSREFLFLTLDSSLTSEVRYLRAGDPFGEFRTLLPRQQGIEYDVEHQGEWFYVRTNEAATNFRLMRTPVDKPSKANWTEIIGARADVTIEGMDGFRDYLVVTERARGLETIRYARADALDHWQFIAFPDPVYTASTGGNAEYAATKLRFTYSSMVTPSSVFDLDFETGARELKKQDEVPTYDAALYTSERVFARAADGVEIPVSLVYRKGLVRDGSHPLMLYGYGSYGLTMDPGFDTIRVSLLDRGYIYAIAHIRGGGDMGKYWHEAGRLFSKKNTFTDFIACAEHLIAQRYTSAERLDLMGGSAGGLLVGAVLNLRPDLFRAGIARVPFVDVINTMLDASLPLTIGEYEEWGNPSEDAAVYRYMRSYSPYDNVTPQRYPKLLIKGGLNDPRVSYWEPAKWAAKLRATKTDGNVLLLRTNMGAGHFGPSGRYGMLRELAFDYAFLLSA
jgi:oligopeptidase B